MIPSLIDFHTNTTKKYQPATTVHQQELTPSSPHFHLVASTRQIRSTYFTSESPLTFSRHTAIQPIKWLRKLSKGSSSHLQFCDQYATISQPMSHGQNLTGFSQTLKRRFPVFHFRTSSFCFFPIFFHWNPPDPLQKITKISIGLEKPFHMLFFCFKENSLLEIALFPPPPPPNPPHTH